VSARAFLSDLERYVADSKLIASPIRFGEWLVERFGEDLIVQRRERERAVQVLEADVRAEGGRRAPGTTLERSAARCPRPRARHPSPRMP